jgi:hypothetical protein
MGYIFFEDINFCLFLGLFRNLGICEHAGSASGTFLIVPELL